MPRKPRTTPPRQLDARQAGSARKGAGRVVNRQRRCFVISPIGQPGSEVREHADDVFEYIIKPAVEAVGYFVHRGDHMTRPGKISDQMYECILNDDLLVAVLTFQNPNVFYELAIAHAAARPLIILCEKDHPLPFDIKDQRVIFYDLRPRSLFSGQFKNELIKAIHELDNPESKNEVPFRPNLSPLGGMGEGFRIFDRYVDAISAGSAPIRTLQGGKSSMSLCGISLLSWHLLPDFREAVAEIVGRGCRLRILIMDGDNEALGHMLNDDLVDHLGKVREELARSWEMWQGLAQGHGNHIAVRRVRRGIVYHQLIMSESQMLYTPYRLSVTSNESTTIQTDSRSPLYASLRREFDFLWRRNEPIEARAAFRQPAPDKGAANAKAGRPAQHSGDGRGLP